MSFQPRIFTFYSYKGGVGRSMALLNMAYYLHARGRHVLIVDLDLEAPGASGFLHRSDELLPRESLGDVVDVLQKVVDAVKQAPEGAEPQLPAMDLKDYLRSVNPEKYATAVHPKAPRARLDVLGAEQGADYTARYSALELSSLNADQVADASDLLRGLLLLHSFPFHQPWQEEDAVPEPTHYDYILVDSRTGLSEIGGLCIGPLSDRLIVLCGLNDQNIEGTRHFLDVVGLKPRTRATTAESFDDADLVAEDGQRPATLGPKPTLLVASPVPGGEMMYKKHRMKELEKRLGMAPAKLSYHPQMALMETLFVRDYEDEYLALEYTTLAERLMGLVGDTVPQLLSPIQRLLADRFNADESKSTSMEARTAHPMVEPLFQLLPPRTSKKKEEKVDAEDLLQRLTRSTLAGALHGPDMPPFMISRLDLSDADQVKVWQLRINLAQTDDIAAQRWLEWADDLDTEEARNSGSPTAFQAIEDKYRKAVTLRPQFYQAFHNWGSALAQWANTKTGAEAEFLYSQASEKFQQAATIQPNDHATFSDWGTFLSDWANTKVGAEAEFLHGQADEKFQFATALEPNNVNTLDNWGLALALRAETKERTEIDALFMRACEKFQQAAAIDPSDITPILHWGSACLRWSLTKEGSESDTLLTRACEKFQQVAAIDPVNLNMLHNWGVTLMQRANTKTDGEADDLVAQACEKFQQAASIEPNDGTRFKVWGSALMQLAKSKTDEEADALFAQACEKLQHASAIEPNDLGTIRALALAFYQWAETKAGVEAEPMLAQACEKFRHVVAITPRDNTTLYLWGTALMQWASTKMGGEAASFLAQACEKFQQASAIEPNDSETLRAWAFVLMQLANTKAGIEADALNTQACEKFQKAVSIDSEDYSMLGVWALALLQRANAKEGIEAEALYAQACEKCHQAAAIAPNDFTTFSTWALALLHLANTKKDTEADVLFDQACEKFQKAVAIEVNDFETLNNWGNALLQRAKNKEGAEADALFVQAGEKFEKVVSIRPNDSGALYNLGCIAALRVQKEAALATLEKWKSTDPEASKAKLDEDSDFDRIRDDPRFQAFRDGLAD
ncbi:KGGVGR-motif variant AAA ATPase [Prosthecobacter fluviatilis]|uniref:KGGVGR-motif variant AAA ATPase n=1 Tax=Prosthecobacter fluviatilis TaxID=445931 RepID=A0ABW0KV86_9BACT